MKTGNTTKTHVSLWVKIIYWIATGIMVYLLGLAAVMYHMSHDMAAGFFTVLGYPTYFIYPLAWLKIAVIVIVIAHRWNDLRDMAYAAYFLNMALALAAHAIHGDSFTHAAAGLVAIAVSYLLGNQVRGIPKQNFFGRWTQRDK